MPNGETKIDFDSLTDRPLAVSDAVIQAVCERIVNKIHPQKVILFGSHQKGSAARDSDLDLFVIIDDDHRLAQLKRRDRYSQILRLFRYKGFGLDVIVLTDREVKKMMAENEGEWDFILEILKEGKALYERTTEVE